MFYPAAAEAQAVRTWVSGTGSDANLCSRAAPCQTFAAAQLQTAAGGEINCLDPAGFGAITITKSLTIDCTGTFGSILASSTTGVLINTAGVKVVLRGLTINGGTPAAPGGSGVVLINGASLSVIDCYISNFTQAGANAGIVFRPTTAAGELQVVNTIIANSRYGIYVGPYGSGSANVTLDRVTVANSAVAGLLVGSGSNLGTGAFVVVRNSEFTANPVGVWMTALAGSNYVVVKLLNSTATSNTETGVRADGPLVRADLSGMTITNNGTGVSAIGGAILLSYLDNLVDRNGAGGDGSFTGSVSKR